MSARNRLALIVAMVALVAIAGGAVAYVRLWTGPGSVSDADGQPEATAQKLTYTAASLKLDGTEYTLDVADTPAKQKLGLGGRDMLADGAGMVFPYAQPGKPCFWMKDMRFAIDMIWLDAARKVVHIQPSVGPDTYPQSYCPESPAQYVVELPAGTAGNAGLHDGDRLDLTL